MFKNISTIINYWNSSYFISPWRTIFTKIRFWKPIWKSGNDWFIQIWRFYDAMTMYTYISLFSPIRTVLSERIFAIAEISIWYNVWIGWKDDAPMSVLFQYLRISWIIPQARIWLYERVATWRFDVQPQESLSLLSRGDVKQVVPSLYLAGKRVNFN